MHNNYIDITDHDRLDAPSTQARGALEAPGPGGDPQSRRRAFLPQSALISGGLRGLEGRVFYGDTRLLMQHVSMMQASHECRPSDAKTLS